MPELCSVYGCPREADTVLTYRNLAGFVERPMCGEHFMSAIGGEPWFVDDRIDESPPPIRMSPEAAGRLSGWSFHHYTLGPLGGSNILMECMIHGRDENLRFMLSGVEAGMLGKILTKLAHEALTQRYTKPGA
jgi:hypothetical protein